MTLSALPSGYRRLGTKRNKEAEAANLRHIKVEWLKCSRSMAYFLHTYGYLQDVEARGWIPFHLWDEQITTLDTLTAHRLVIILKARQLGLSWLVLGYALWLMIFRPVAIISLFSKRDDEAIELLDTRLKGMYDRLPEWMRCRMVLEDSKHIWRLSNGSVARAFPTTGGESYAATLAIIDEADKTPNLDVLLNAVQPTVDAGGKLFLVSTVDKSKPQSSFKRTYQGAKAGLTEWTGVFLPWRVRPGRDDAWYERRKADILARTGALDDLWQEYPASDEEALAPRTLDKRIPAAWLLQCYYHRAPLVVLPANAPSISGLEVYSPPLPGRQYVIGADPAEGNPTSDDSALTVMDKRSGEEVAALAGKFEPSIFGGYIDRIGRWYNFASVLPERNNHGHALIMWLREHSRLSVLRGIDGQLGWLSSSKGKVLMYDAAADAFRNRETMLHSYATYLQLASIEGATLLAPDGERDDRADGYALALVGASQSGSGSSQGSYTR